MARARGRFHAFSSAGSFHAPTSELCVVTGGARGIGLAIAQAFHDEGAMSS
jgi:hypothetical protein